MLKPLAAVGEILKNLFTKSNTENYPFTKAKVDPKFRAKIKYIPELCVGCNMCVRNCPALAIKIILLNPQDKAQLLPEGKVIPVKRKFQCDIDLTKCIFCAQCVDSCFKKALLSTQEFELASTDKSTLMDITKPEPDDQPIQDEPSKTECSVITSCEKDPRNLVEK